MLINVMLWWRKMPTINSRYRHAKLPCKHPLIGSKCTALIAACLLTVTIPICGQCQAVSADGTSAGQNLLTRLCQAVDDSLFQQVFRQPDKYRLQILYTKIDRDRKNHPHFTSYRYHCKDQAYFNPASTVKMPISFLSLEKLNMLHQYGITKDSYMLTDSSNTGQQSIYKDTTSASGYPSVASYIKRIFLVSDNDAYNRLYELLGQEYIQKQLRQKGYTHTRINRRFYPMSDEQNRHTNQIRFLQPDTTLRCLLVQPPAFNPDSFHYGPPILIGNAHMDSQDQLIDKPYDFSRGNLTTLADLTNMLKAVIFPQSVPPENRFQLSEADRLFLLQYMSQYPGETNYPKYDSTKFFDSYSKFFFRNAGHRLPPYVRSFNKPGWSYGFLTNVAYIVDYKHQIEFMLSCTLYVNEDGIINDNKYDYDSIGFPFMTKLGQAIYHYELSRTRKHLPDLSELTLQYEQRVDDNRALIRGVAN